MKIRYHGHACFTIEREDGSALLMDPYNDSVGYPLVMRRADVVTCSHGHGDHSYLGSILPGYVKVEGAGPADIKGFSIRPVASFHDNAGGSQRGENTIYCVEADGVRVAHLGDLGHMLTAEQLAAIGRCDVLMVPIGGYYTIDAATAAKVTEAVDPIVVIPMHYRTRESARMPIATEEEYLAIMQGDAYAISNLSDAVLELDSANLPRAKRVVIMEYK